MKTVSLFIANYNAGDCVKLAVESIRKYTAYPYRLTVRDDCTQSDYYDDLTYLRECADKGWLTFEQNEERVGHGGVLDILFDKCDADLAVYLDCDIQILGPSWLEPMIEAQEKTGAAIVADVEQVPGNNTITTWFFMVDMRQYPLWKSTWGYVPKDDWSEDNPNSYWMTGAVHYNEIMRQGLTIAPCPDKTRRLYRHYTHMSCLSMPQRGKGWALRQGRYAEVQKELRRLRAGQ